MTEEPIRVLVVGENVAVLSRISNSLSGYGLSVQVTTDPTETVASAVRSSAEIILVVEPLELISGADLIERLSESNIISHLPVVAVLTEVTELGVLRALWAGASDVFFLPLRDEWIERIQEVIERAETQEPQNRLRRVAANLIRLYQQARRTGTLSLNPETPFEGTAKFDRGTLLHAEYGPLLGVAALEEMLWFQDGLWQFDGLPWALPEPDTDPLGRPRASKSNPTIIAINNYEPSFLFVDDDKEVSMLMESKLTSAGFSVRLSTNGEDGFLSATNSVPDLILTDLDMPRLDGWGLLRRLKVDHRTREVPVVMYSGVDDVQETLRAARAGAHDYLSKRISADAVVARMVELVRPFLVVRQLLSQKGESTEVSAAVGIQWVLRQLAFLRCTGVLHARDAWGSYSLRVRNGDPWTALSITPQPGTDLGAVGALLCAHHPRLRFEPAPTEGARELNLSMGALLSQVNLTLNRLADRGVDRRLSTAPGFHVDMDLFQLFLRFSTPRETRVACALVQQDLSPEEIAVQLGIEADEVQRALRELFHRRVLQPVAVAPNGA